MGIAFWTPYNGNVNPCPQGVQYKIWTDGTWDPPPAEASGKVVAYSVKQKGNCFINFAPKWTYLAKNPQTACMIVIHELGHSAMGLDHSPEGLMRPKITDVHPMGRCYSIPRRLIPSRLFVTPLPRRRAGPSRIPLGNARRQPVEAVPIELRSLTVG